MVLRTIFLTACIIAAFLFQIPTAYAIFNINSTDIRYHMLNIELRNRVDDDDRASKDGFQAHAVKWDYGVTKRWSVEGQFLWQDVPQHGFAYTATQIENKFRFWDPGEYWLDFAWKIGYEFRHDANRADTAQTKFLFQKKSGAWTHVANINLSKEVGHDTVKDMEMNVGWRTKYTIKPYFEPGFEYYNNFGELVDMPDYNGQQHRIGPMFFGEIVPGVKYQLGYLFGLSKAAEDGSFKFFIRYEIPL